MADEQPEGTAEETKPEEQPTTDQGDGAATEAVSDDTALDK